MDRQPSPHRGFRAKFTFVSRLREGDTLRRSIEAKDFPAAIRIVDGVAVEAEQMAHHPDIDIRWRTLHFTLSTHSAGGITQLDVELAHRISVIAETGLS